MCLWMYTLYANLHIYRVCAFIINHLIIDHNHELYRRHTILKKIQFIYIPLYYNPANHAKRIKQC